MVSFTYEQELKSEKAYMLKKNGEQKTKNACVFILLIFSNNSATSTGAVDYRPQVQEKH